MDASTTWSRRTTLVMAAATVGAAALAAAPGVAGGATARATAPLGLRRADWTPLVGRRVAVDGPGGRVRALVVGVEDLRGAAPGDARCFSVELRTDRGPAVHGLCPITIPGRGVTTLLVSAVDRGVRHRSSQIVVNSPRD
ncbi:MAG TPA: hypothetical protein VFU19_04140 [Iamia sp.]|nr:hypothetical protein [Iamia sp.]